MSSAPMGPKDWSSAEVQATASRTRRLYEQAVAFATLGYEGKIKDVMGPAAILTLIMLLDLHFNQSERKPMEDEDAA